MYETARLILRPYEDKDFDSFCKINQDSRVMQYFPNVLTTQGVVELTDKIKRNFSTYGFGFYTCELKLTKQFAGFVGLNYADFTSHFTPCFEIGWRIMHEMWGRGIALEAAQKALDIGFNQYNLEQIVAFTAKNNHKSERVMQKLGMTHTEDDNFYHPKLPKNHPLSLQILYRMKKELWNKLYVSRETK